MLTGALQNLTSSVDVEAASVFLQVVSPRHPHRLHRRCPDYNPRPWDCRRHPLPPPLPQLFHSQPILLSLLPLLSLHLYPLHYSYHVFLLLLLLLLQ
jgi:hypothetical protein